MMEPEITLRRQSVIAALVRRREGLGRTALMKLVYFLQSLRGVALGYDFRIYTYGPYDGQVLDDLQALEAAGGARSQYYEYDYGTGYRISCTERTNEVARQADNEFNAELDWVTREFGSLGAVDLETASTVVFVDRQNVAAGDSASVDAIADAVREMKPHLQIARIRAEVEDLKARGMLRAVA